MSLYRRSSILLSKLSQPVRVTQGHRLSTDATSTRSGAAHGYPRSRASIICRCQCAQESHVQVPPTPMVTTKKECLTGSRCFSTTNRVTCSSQTSGLLEVCDRQTEHVPVMVEEVLNIIKPKELKAGEVVIDMTFGSGGHSKALLQQNPDIRIFGLDRDQLAYQQALTVSQKYAQITPLLGRFTEVRQLLLDKLGLGEDSVAAILFDVGASSMQFDDGERGFSISQTGPLDMRMDGNRFADQVTADDVVNHMSEESLSKVLKKYGEEKMARQIAHAIVDSRYAFGRIKTTSQLADIIASVFDSPDRRDKLMRHSHVATKTFQALRIFVNDELNELHNGLKIAHRLLRPGGVCATITFHSLEDRIAKRHFHGIDIEAKLNMSITDQHRSPGKSFARADVMRLMDRRWEPISRRVMAASDEEVVSNPRARSAKLRAAYKI